MGSIRCAREDVSDAHVYDDPTRLMRPLVCLHGRSWLVIVLQSGEVVFCRLGRTSWVRLIGSFLSVEGLMTMEQELKN